MASTTTTEKEDETSDDKVHQTFDIRFLHPTIEILTIPARSDNYMYLIVDKSSDPPIAGVVDPFDSDRIANVCKTRGIVLDCILTTHSHYDHDGGNEDCIKCIPSIKKIYGGVGDGVKGVTIEVDETSRFTIGTIPVTVLSTPCHTKGHVCYMIHPSSSPSCLFTGDTMFVGGCGNFNAGTPKMMAEAFSKLGRCSKDTLVYVGHEYTIANLQYAAYVEPKNETIRKKLIWAKDRVEKGLFTVPTTIGQEHLTNPFLRAVFGVESVRQHCNKDNPIDAIAYVRSEKSDGRWKKKIETSRV